MKEFQSIEQMMINKIVGMLKEESKATEEKKEDKKDEKPSKETIEDYAWPLAFAYAVSEDVIGKDDTEKLLGAIFDDTITEGEFSRMMEKVFNKNKEPEVKEEVKTVTKKLVPVGEGDLFHKPECSVKELGEIIEKLLGVDVPVGVTLEDTFGDTTVTRFVFDNDDYIVVTNEMVFKVE